MRWAIIQSTPSSKAYCLKEILQQKFPKYIFSYWKLTSSKLKDSSKVKEDFLDGLIIELKSLTNSNLDYFDKLQSLYQDTDLPKIYILTPAGYKILSEKRRDQIDHSLIVLSEVISLDYLIQLPRLIQEVGVKRKLKSQNERLQKLISKKLPQLEASRTNTSVRFVQNLLNEENDLHRGLKVTLKSWPKIKKSLGNDSARGEVLEVFNRLISSVVRNSDRILHASENEFVIFLSNASTTTVNRCKDRLEEALRLFRIQANDRDLTLPFQIASLELEKTH